MAEYLKERKQHHLDICLDSSEAIETGTTGLESIGLPHTSLPVTAPSAPDLGCDFLGYRLKLPLMISCMTGGSREGRKLNRLLAESAGKKGIAVGTGSIRVLLDHPETFDDFALKDVAADVPLLVNIGAAQLVEGRNDEILGLAGKLNADGIFVHLNAAQEIFQPGGDLNFDKWAESVSAFLKTSAVPVLVKETGAGIPPSDGLNLLRQGAAYIDVAGSGGTDWVAVEARRLPENQRVTADSFTGWGYPTAELLLAYRQIQRAGGESGSIVDRRIIASGGLRSPRDYAIALACGSWIAASALPFIRRAAQGGIEAVDAYIDSIEEGIRTAIALSGHSSLEDFRRTEIRLPSDLLDRAEVLAERAVRSNGVSS